MKISSVSIYSLSVREGLNIIGCRVLTDEGIYGDGEAGLAYGWAYSSAQGALYDLSQQIIGADPFCTEYIWDKLYKESFWGQNGGPSFFGALSAIDMALWDIRGKALNVPVYQLLGGKRRNYVQCYASHVQYGWDKAAASDWLVKQGGPKRSDYARRAELAVADGFHAIKMDLWEFDDDGNYQCENAFQNLLSREQLYMLESRLYEVRQAVGQQINIILDAHAAMSVPAAVQFSEIAKKYQIFYLEEPTVSSPQLVQQLSGRSDVPLAYGERIYTRWQFLPYLEQHYICVAQPDIGNSGGLTEVKKIADLAQLCDISVQPHVCASPLSVAAALQLEAVLSNFLIHEFYFEQQNEYMKKLCQYVHEPKDGLLSIPCRCGIGNEWSEWFLHSASVVSVK